MQSRTRNGPAALSIKFVIVGGGKCISIILPSDRIGFKSWISPSIVGIAGLSAAYALCKAGHEVRVLEKAPKLGFPSSGLRVPPNMSKILKNWVGAEELDKLTVLNVATPCIDCKCSILLRTIACNTRTKAEHAPMQ